MIILMKKRENVKGVFVKVTCCMLHLMDKSRLIILENMI